MRKETNLLSKQQKEFKNKQIMFTVTVTHILISTFFFYCAFLVFRYQGISQIDDWGFRYNYFTALAYVILHVFFGNTFNAYLYGYIRIRGLAFNQFLSQFFSIIIIYLSVSIGWNKYISPMIFAALLFVYALLDCAWSYWGNKLYFKLNQPRKTLLIYRNAQDKKRISILVGKPTERLYKIVKELQFDGTFEEIKHRLDGYDAIFVAGLNSRCRNGILKYCEMQGIRGFFLPHIGDMIMQGAEHVQAFDSPVLQVRRKTLSPEYRVIKRAFDIILSVFGLIVTSPLIFLIAIAIKCYDRGPVFYKQTRLTRDERTFKIIKFRSMRTDAEKDGIARLSKGDKDERITPVGRLVRKCRFDELPQLINILKGEMSFVGPRPERPEIAEQYCEKMPEFKLRLQVKAGLTGYAQVFGKYNTDPYEKLEFDLLYINHMSILTDLQLIFSTFGILFKKESTEGVEGITAFVNEENQ